MAHWRSIPWRLATTFTPLASSSSNSPSRHWSHLLTFIRPIRSRLNLAFIRPLGNGGVAGFCFQIGREGEARPVSDQVDSSLPSCPRLFWGMGSPCCPLRILLLRSFAVLQGNFLASLLGRVRKRPLEAARLLQPRAWVSLPSSTGGNKVVTYARQPPTATRTGEGLRFFDESIGFSCARRPPLARWAPAVAMLDKRVNRTEPRSRPTPGRSAEPRDVSNGASDSDFALLGDGWVLVGLLLGAREGDTARLRALRASALFLDPAATVLAARDLIKSPFFD